MVGSSAQLMETMLALLHPGVDDGILFKTLYVTKLPREVRTHVLAHGMQLDSREMADLADDIWCSLNERHSGAKAHHVAAAVPEDGEELAEVVAALNVQPKRSQHKKTAARGGKSRENSAKPARSTENKHGSVKVLSRLTIFP